ncbi:hypothetical protein [Rhodohalobacter sp.]|uniref:hypothetical protein n=1 Tax=Rhodohalobacter sp. TaxID=1974210 RepID=UPI002ACE07DA|nr:hypothetical protein [Rhodohalobacter sp.]MDZ7756839.1 hypothetical protein [Rhodohalobacter sp.]
MKTLLLTAIFLIGMSPGLNAQNVSFSDFNDDGNENIDMQEFKDTFTAYFMDDWDNTDNAGLDDEDFYLFTYDMIDTDDDDLINSAEWDVGYDYYYGEVLEDDLVVYDLDGDGYISYMEYNTAVVDTDYYATLDVDADTFLDQEELAESVFNTWDTNEDMELSKGEFINFDLYYGDV